MRSMKLTPSFFSLAGNRRKGRIVRAGRARIYYEVYGRGKPLLLLHGGLSCIDGLRHQIPFFARRFKVYLPERPGHGHTADISGPYTYEAMASQTAAFMDALRIKKALLMGYSDGANLLFRLALRRPDLVDRFISVGGNIHHSGCEPSFQRELKKQKVSGVDPRYEAYSPDDPAHFYEVFEKCRRLWLTQPKWNMGMLKKIKASVLIVAGDRDMIRHEHSVRMFRALKNAQLAIVPGASHAALKEKPGLLNKIMLEFFTGRAVL
jgi:pimeloyl-ACP methyl ester carboxylesterase